MDSNTKNVIDLFDKFTDGINPRIQSENVTHITFNPCGDIWAENVQQKVDSTECDVTTKGIYISERIIASISYLQTFFKIRANKKLLSVILQVLEDVKFHFLNLPTVGKRDLLLNAFASFVSNNKQILTNNSVSSVKEMSLLSQQEKELLYFCYSINFCERQNYNNLFDTYFSMNKPLLDCTTADSEKLSYFEKFDNFAVDKKGIVKPHLHLHLQPRFSSYSLESHNTSPSLVLSKIPQNSDSKSFSTITTDSNIGARQNNEKSTNGSDMWCKNNLTYKIFSSSTISLLHSSETLSYRPLTKFILHIFPGIRICLNKFPIENQREVFSSIVFTVVNNNHLQLQTSCEVDNKYISESIVSYLALYGKTHFSKLLEEFHQCVPHGTIHIFKGAKDYRWYGYLEISSSKHLRFEFDSLGFLSLVPLFDQTVLNDRVELSQSLCNDGSLPTSERGAISNELQPSEKIDYIITGLSAINQDILSRSENYFLTDIKTNETERISRGITKSEKMSVLVQLVALNESNPDVTPNPVDDTSLKSEEKNFIPLVKLDNSISTFSNIIPYSEPGERNKEALALELTETGRNQIKKNRKSLPVNISRYNNPSLEQMEGSVDKSASDSDVKNDSVSRNTTSNWLVSTERIRMMIIKGISFLQEYFKCTSGMHLACIVLHVLHEAKQQFISLSYSEQIDLIGKIFAPGGTAGVQSSLDSLETFELNNEQKNMLLISYILSLNEKSHYNTLLQKFEENDIHFITNEEYFKARSTFFSIDGSGRIELIDFPPVEWMFEYLSLISKSSFGKSGTSKSESVDSKRFDHGEISSVKLSKPTKEMNTKNTSGYSQYMLDSLSEILHDGIVCLFQNFEVFINSGILEVVLHSVKNCSFFFGLPYIQQKEVVRASFRPFRIDKQGRVISYEAMTQKKFKLTEKVKELLCISYIIRQNGSLHCRQVLMMYQECSRKKICTDELGYFREREDLFFVDDRGYVILVNVPAIRWHYVNFIISDKVCTSNTLHKLAEDLDVSNSKCENMSQNKLVSLWSSKGERPTEEISLVEANWSGRKENIHSVELSKEKTAIQKETGLAEVKRLTDRVRNSISYLSHYFVLIANTDLLYLILSVLKDVKIYYLNLTAQNREDFIKECFSSYYISSGGFILDETLPNSCMICEEEKIDLLNAYQLKHQRELHNIKTVKNFPEYNVSKTTYMDNVKEKKVIDGSTLLKSGVSDFKTKYFGETKTTGVVPPFPTLDEKPMIQLNGNLPPWVNTNWCKSSIVPNFSYLNCYYMLDNNTVRDARQTMSLYSSYGQPLSYRMCVPNDIFSPKGTRQDNATQNCNDCVALSWTEITIFEEDESYYNSLIDSFLGM